MALLAFSFALRPFPDLNVEFRGITDVLAGSATSKSATWSTLTYRGANKKRTKGKGFSG